MGILRTAFYMAVGFAAGFLYRQYQTDKKQAPDLMRPSKPRPSKEEENEEGEVTVAETAPSAAKKIEVAVQDDLTKIKGIGPTFARRFLEADVRTFADLAQLSPERAREISGLKEWQPADPADWIAQAAELS